VRAGPVYVLVPTLVVASCQKNIARPPLEEVPIRDASETAAPPASIAVIRSSGKDAKPPILESDADASPASASADPEPPRDKAFPRTSDACKRDDECATTNLALGGELMCCAPCSRAVAGTKGWVRKVEQICAQKARSGWKPHCASSDCSRAEAECKSGRCVVK
jgi:hypothetical protein